MTTLMINNKPNIINVTFSQLFRNVLQPLKLEIGRSESIDWLSFLLFRFNGYLSLLPQNVPDLKFALQKMDKIRMDKIRMDKIRMDKIRMDKIITN